MSPPPAAAASFRAAITAWASGSSHGSNNAAADADAADADAADADHDAASVPEFGAGAAVKMWRYGGEGHSAKSRCFDAEKERPHGGSGSVTLPRRCMAGSRSESAEA